MSPLRGTKQNAKIFEAYGKIPRKLPTLKTLRYKKLEGHTPSLGLDDRLNNKEIHPIHILEQKKRSNFLLSDGRN